MSASALVCLALVVKRLKPSPLSICWFAAVSKSPLPASPAMVTGDYLLARRGCWRMRRWLVADGEYDVIVLHGGIKGAECFRDSTLLVETVKQFHRSGRIVAAICAAPATVLVPHDIFPIGNMTGFPTLKDKIPAEQWQDKRVVWDAGKIADQPRAEYSYRLWSEIIDLLVGREKAHEVASQLVMAAGFIIITSSVGCGKRRI